MVLVKKGGVKVDEGTKVDPADHKHEHKEAPSEKKEAPEPKETPAKPDGKAADGKAVYECSMDGGTRESPGPCPKCKMTLTEKDRLKQDAKPGAPKDHDHEEKKPLGPELKNTLPKQDEPKAEEKKAGEAPKTEEKTKYLCTMDGGLRDTPGPCPKCQMALMEKDRVKAGVPKIAAPQVKEGPHVHEEKKQDPPKMEAMKPEAPKAAEQAKPEEKSDQEFIYKCPMDAAVRDTPGPCPKCKMPLDERHKVPKPKAERTIYVCDVHPEEVSDKPGQCFKESCAGMILEPRKIVPGAKLIYVCPVHPEIKSDKPGVCPKEKCGKKLGFKIVSEATQLSEMWACPLHPQRTAGGKLQCPDCGREMKHMEVEQVLAVPFSAVIDTGVRKVVFVDKGHGTFDAMEVELGPRAGEYYPVMKGLAAGDRVVTAGAFLLDAETRLNPAAGVIYFGASGGEKK